MIVAGGGGAARRDSARTAVFALPGCFSDGLRARQVTDFARPRDRGVRWPCPLGLANRLSRPMAGDEPAFRFTQRAQGVA